MIASFAVVEHKYLYHFNLHFKSHKTKYVCDMEQILQQNIIHSVYYIKRLT